MSFETAFAAALLDPERPAPEGLFDPEGRPAGKRYDVYRNNVVVSLTDALGVAFPVIRALVGEANFRVLARAFLAGHPPRDPRLMLWGDALPGFLETYPRVRTLGYLPDVARLEQAMRESYHAADAPAFDPAGLAALPPEKLTEATFAVAPSVRLLSSRWPALSIWRYNAEPGAPKPQMAAEDVLVSRPGFDPVARLLPTGGAAFAGALAGGAPLGAALGADGVPADFDLDAALTALLQGGAFTQTGDPS
ncbi:MAG: DNA-binding domain-containing protein [Paracoccaceae bacterium]|nr:DNA-binding domain-containing protein [Paracoccaceae bacterium]